MILSEKTKVPLGLAVTVISAVACWVTAVNIQLFSVAKAVESLNETQKQLMGAVGDSQKEMAVLGVRVQELTDKLRRNGNGR